MSENQVNRRQFLKITGCGAVIALTGAGCSLAGQKAEAACPFGMINDPYPGECGRYVDVNGDGICDLSEGVEATTTQSTESTASVNASENVAAETPAESTATSTPGSVVQSQVPSVASSGQVICSHGCSYPGRCDRYTDTNNNGTCDLSEYTAAEAAAAGGALAQAASTSSQSGRGGSGRGGRH